MKIKASIRISIPTRLVHTQSMRIFSHTCTVCNHLTGGFTTFLPTAKISTTTSSKLGRAPCHVHSLLAGCCFHFVCLAYRIYFRFVFLSYYFCLCLFGLLHTFLFLFPKISVAIYQVLDFEWVCGWDMKRLVTLMQHLANLVSIFSVLGYNLWPMKSWWNIWDIYKGSFGPAMNLCPHWEASFLYSTFCYVCWSSSN